VATEYTTLRMHYNALVVRTNCCQGSRYINAKHLNHQYYMVVKHGRLITRSPSALTPCKYLTIADFFTAAKNTKKLHILKNSA